MNRFALSALLAVMPCVCQAGLLGDTVSVTYQFGVATTVDDVVVTSGIEVTCPGSSSLCSFLTLATQTVDIGDTTITYLKTGPSTGSFTTSSFNGFRFSSLDFGAPIGGVTLATNITGLDSSRIVFGATTLDINMSGLPIAEGSTFSVTLNPVPEPVTWALAAAGVALVAVGRRYLDRR